jgi:DeoR/GlpR family transcriptional regulator of sugar metabolism
MLKKERQAYIMRRLDLHNKVLSSSLSAEMNVSEDTVRRDLLELSEEGKVIKVHGGALSRSFNFMYERDNIVYSHEGKKRIAAKAAQLVTDGMIVMTSGGTTIGALAQALPTDLQATFVTGSVPAALAFMQHPGIEVILIGDRVSKQSKITVGGDAVSRISSIRADLCILGVNAIDPVRGVTDNDHEVVQVKRAMVRSAAKVACVSILEKTGSSQPYQVCPIDDIDILVTDVDPGRPELDDFRKKVQRII